MRSRIPKLGLILLTGFSYALHADDKPNKEQLRRIANETMIDLSYTKDPKDSTPKFNPDAAQKGDTVIRAAEKLSQELVRRGYSEEEARATAKFEIEDHPLVRDTCQMSKITVNDAMAYDYHEKANASKPSNETNKEPGKWSGPVCSVGEQLQQKIEDGFPVKPPAASKPTEKTETVDGTPKKTQDNPSLPSKSDAPIAQQPAAPGGGFNPFPPVGLGPQAPSLGKALPEPSVTAGMNTDTTHKSDMGRTEDAAVEPTSTAPLSVNEYSPIPASPENVQAVRKALDEKVLRREIEPEVAASLMDKLTPVLAKEPDLLKAIDKAGAEVNVAARTSLPAYSPSTNGSQYNAQPSLNAQIATNPGAFGLVGALPAVSDKAGGPSKTLDSSDQMAKKISASLAKKNALTPSKMGANLKSSLASSSAGMLIGNGEKAETAYSATLKVDPLRDPGKGFAPSKTSRISEYVSKLFQNKHLENTRIPSSEPIGPVEGILGKITDSRVALASLGAELGLDAPQSEVVALLAFLAAFGTSFSAFGLLKRSQKKK